MSLANSNESLSVYSFIVKHLSKGTKNLAQPYVAVLIAESIGRSFGKLLNNGLWILDKPYIIPSCEPLAMNEYALKDSFEFIRT